ncbi:hypothetical protein RB653_002713 [Dictyostelium firmibasis]|uniref:PH domain-containing protein n=1 Tax=Dictyostelium firmibasis TaxID=79012 RepID=A0AAN7TYR5_9MYCE
MSLSSSVSISPSISSSSISNNRNSRDLEDKYGDSVVFPCPSKFEKIIPLDERYITHATFLKNKSSETTFIGLLTSNRFYKIDSDTLKKIWSIDLFDMHSIEGDESPDPKTLRIVYHIRQSPSLVGGLVNGGGSGGSNSNHNGSWDNNNPEMSPPDSPTIQSRLSSSIKRGSSSSSSLSGGGGGGGGGGISNDNYISEKIFITESEEIRDQWLVSLRLLTRQTFQKYFESTFIPAPAIYQLHIYAYKTNRKGKNQIRCILVSTERCYNISIKTPSLEIGKIKWSFPIAALKTLQVFKSAPNILVLTLDNKENTKVKEVQQFILKDLIERNLLTNELRRIYSKLTKQSLTKDEKDELPKKFGKGK